MIELNGYNVTAALIIGAGAIELYKQWKVGHDLAKMYKEEICEFMSNRGYVVHMDDCGQPYFVKDDKRYSYKYIHDLAGENKLTEIY